MPLKRKAKEKMDAAKVVTAAEMDAHGCGMDNPYMTMTDKTEYVLGIWFVGGQEMDMLAQIVASEGKISGVCRIRMYDEDDPGNDPWIGKDRKHGLTYGPFDDTPENRATAIADMNSVAARADLLFGEGIHHFEGGTGEEAMQWLVAQPFAHVRKVESAGKES